MVGHADENVWKLFEMTINEEMEEEDGTRFYQCQPQSLTYGDQFSDKNNFFQVRIAGGDRQCLKAFLPIRQLQAYVQKSCREGTGWEWILRLS